MPPISPPMHQLQVQEPGPSEIGFPALLRAKRVLLATESLGQINGVSRTTQSLIQYLRDNGVHVAVVAPKSKDYRSRLKTSNDPEVRVHGYPLPHSPDLTIAYPLRLDRLYNRTFKPDLIYLASPASLGFQVLLQIRQLYSPAPVLLNFQTDLSSYGEIIFPSPMDQYAVWLLRVVQGFLFNHSAVRTIFYPSGMVRDYLVHAGAPVKKMVHLGRGVDTALFSPSSRDEVYRTEIAPNGEFVLVCVGRLAPEKGFGFLSQVALKLAERNLNFKLVIVGGNKNSVVENEVHQLFRDVHGQVVFTGFLEGAALARAYASADVFVHCSITETFGLVVLEAMASGLPVVARDCGGPSEIVRDQKSGFLIPPGNLDRFVACVEALAKNMGLREELATNARVIACDTTWNKINNRVAWQLAKALETGASKPGVSSGKAAPIRSWIMSHLLTVLSSVIVVLRLNAAIGLICFIWLVAVVPLLVHGNSAMPNIWHRFHSISTWSSVGSVVSNGLKLKGR